jgi:hypothetical protein
MMATLCAPFSISILAAARTSSALIAVRIVPSASVRSSTQVAIGDRREIAPQAPGTAPVAAAHLQHVTKTARRDDADPGAAPLQQRVGADRGAVHDRALCHVADRRKAIEKTACLIAAP